MSISDGRRTAWLRVELTFWIWKSPAHVPVPAGWQVIEETFAGVRFVSNQMGYHLDPADFLQPKEGHPGHSDVMS
jgi:hypothetical protein